jgi:hypothetical protein
LQLRSARFGRFGIEAVEKAGLDLRTRYIEPFVKLRHDPGYRETVSS